MTREMVNLHPAQFPNARSWFDALGIPAATAEYLQRLTVSGGRSGGGRHGGFVVTDSAHPGLVFELELANGGGVLSYAARVSDDAEQNGATLTARALREVRVMDLALACRLRHVLALAELVDPADAKSAAALVAWLVRPGSLNPEVAPDTRRPREVTDAMLARAMSDYLALLDAGVQPSEVAGRLGFSVSKLANWKERARNAGLFESRGHGRAGGRLTDAGRALLVDDAPIGSGGIVVNLGELHPIDPADIPEGAAVLVVDEA